MKHMSVKETAAYLGASQYKTYELARQKKIPHFKIGAKIVFRKSALDQWIMQQELENCSNN